MKTFKGQCSHCGFKGNVHIIRIKKEYPEFNDLLIKEKGYLNFGWEVEGLCFKCRSSVYHKICKDEFDSIMNELINADEIEIINWWRRI